jgi:phage shock protein A
MIGWDKVGKAEFVVNEKEAELYRVACSLVEQGYGYRRIAKKMYELGARQENEKEISEVLWRKMLLSPRYHGECIMHSEEFDFYKKKRVKVPEEEWIIADGLIPAIVDKEYHEKIIKILEDRAEKFKNSTLINTKTTLAGKYTFSKKIICAECGKPYYRCENQFKDGKRADWVCSTFLARGKGGCINTKVDEKQLMELVKQACEEHYNKIYLDDDSLINQTLEILNKTFNSDEIYSRQKSISKKIEKIKKDQKTWREKLLAGVVGDDEYKEYADEMMNERKKLEEQLDNIKKQIDRIEFTAERLEKIKEAMINNSIINKAKTDQLSKKVSKIMIYKNGDVDIYFSMEKILEDNELQLKETNDDNEKNYYIITKQYERVRPEIIRKRAQEEAVYQLLVNNPKIKMEEIEKTLGIKTTTVYLRLKALKEQGRVRYRHSQSGNGQWEII